MQKGRLFGYCPVRNHEMRIGGKAAFAVSFDAARFALQEMLNGGRTDELSLTGAASAAVFVCGRPGGTRKQK